MLEINKTARRELVELVEEGLLKVVGKGRRFEENGEIGLDKRYRKKEREVLCIGLDLSDIYRTFGLIGVEPKKVDLRGLGLNERLKSVEHAEKMGSITNREYQRLNSMLLNESKNWLSDLR